MTLFTELVQGKHPLNPLWRKPLYRLKFAARALFLNHNTFRWLHHLERYPERDTYLRMQTNLPCKLQRPYLASTLSNRQCLQALINHYDFLSALPDRFTEAVYSHELLWLATVEGKNGAQFTIKLGSNDLFSREGEMTIYLHTVPTEEEPSPLLLSALTFTILQWQGEPTLLIAGLQGPRQSKTNNPRQMIQQATKQCFGLFPKRILIEAIMSLSETLGITQVIAISNKNHIYNNWRYREKLKQIQASYDEFWLSLGAEFHADRFYHLPLPIARKSLEEIPSKKRSEYRQRYQLLDQLKTDITTVLDRFTNK